MNRLVSVCIISSLFITGCASKSLKENVDPYEGFNRGMYAFNDGVFKYVAKPVTRAYRAVVPHKARNGIRNFFANIDTVPAIANDILQVKPKLTVRHIVRLVLNSTLGVFGLVDVASQAGFKDTRQSFGLTLASWGYSDSAYLVLPFYGPSTVRDGLGRIPDMLMKPTASLNPERDRYLVQGFDAMQTVSHVIPRYESLTQGALDPYVAVRNAYLQNQKYFIRHAAYDGNPPPEVTSDSSADLMDALGEDYDWDEMQ